MSLPDKLALAWRAATEAHHGQRFPGTDLPYLLHLSQVQSEVVACLQIEPAMDAELSLVCAVLHDIVEDTDVTAAQVEAEFGAEVARGVAALSKDKSLPKSAAMADSLARIKACPPAVWKVKLADRVSNLQEPPVFWSREKCMAYRDEAKLILDALGEASPALAERLAARIDAYEAKLPAQ